MDVDRIIVAGGTSGVDRPSHLSPWSAPGNVCHYLILSSYSLNYGGVCLASDAQFSDFLGSMGPAQFVGRQTLATTPMGECPKTCSNGGSPIGSPASPPSSPLPQLHLLSTHWSLAHTWALGRAWTCGVGRLSGLILGWTQGQGIYPQRSGGGNLSP